MWFKTYRWLYSEKIPSHLLTLATCFPYPLAASIISSLRILQWHFMHIQANINIQLAILSPNYSLTPFSPFPLLLFVSSDALDCCLHFAFPHISASFLSKLSSSNLLKVSYYTGRSSLWILVGRKFLGPEEFIFCPLPFLPCIWPAVVLN